jgi:hypothetical protein
MTPTFNGTKSLKIDFESVQYGLMHFTLMLGDKSFETRFSDVYDPIPSFKKWLEAISIGVEQCSFWFDTEGKDIKFDLARVSYDKELFTVTEPYDDADIFLSDYVDRRQLVEVLYFGLLEFRNSSNFIKDEWEIEYMWERLTGILKIDYETLLDEFSKFDREGLKRLLFKADPRYLASCPSAPEEEAFGYLVDDFLGNEIPSVYEIVETPMEWNIPEDYDDWSIERKKALVKECLDEATSGQEGTKIEDFKSKIIENYLNQSPESKKVNGSTK